MSEQLRFIQPRTSKRFRQHYMRESHPSTSHDVVSLGNGRRAQPCLEKRQHWQCQFTRIALRLDLVPGIRSLPSYLSSKVTDVDPSSNSISDPAPLLHGESDKHRTECVWCRESIHTLRDAETPCIGNERFLQHPSSMDKRD